MALNHQCVAADRHKSLGPNGLLSLVRWIYETGETPSYMNGCAFIYSSIRSGFSHAVLPPFAIIFVPWNRAKLNRLLTPPAGISGVWDIHHYLILILRDPAPMQYSEFIFQDFASRTILLK